MVEKFTPTVGVVAFRENKVLLIRHGKSGDQIEESVGIPTGVIEKATNEKSVDAAARTLQIRTGHIVSTDNLHRFPHNHYWEKHHTTDGMIKVASCEVFLASDITGDTSENEEPQPFWENIDTINRLPLRYNVEKVVKAADIFRKTRSHS